MVIHDPTLDRTTDGSGPVEERVLDELRRLDAGYGFTPDGGDTFPYRGQGIRIPTLVIIPGRDQMIPAGAQRETAGLIPGARLIEFPRARHEVLLTDAREVAAAIRTHL